MRKISIFRFFCFRKEPFLISFCRILYCYKLCVIALHAACNTITHGL
ncbi:hypothetical protein SAMN05216383_103138 [Prevotella sp. KH2C16]|nr:hypothetical protein SAMN05216383_103138 [Prevotella sp. KH2C16]